MVLHMIGVCSKLHLWTAKTRGLNIPPAHTIPSDDNGKVIPFSLFVMKPFPPDVIWSDLMWPYLTNTQARDLTDDGKIYNYHLCIARWVVENLFATLTKTFYISRGRVILSPDVVDLVVRQLLCSITSWPKLEPMHLWMFLILFDP